MVNELNKPPSQENLALGEPFLVTALPIFQRLLASQQQLQQMQEEHRQLLQEMEILRQRAADLSRLNEHQFSQMSNQRRSTEETGDTSAINHQTPLGSLGSDIESNTLNETVQETVTTEQQTTDTESTTNSTNDNNTITAAAVEGEEEDDDPETAEYLQKKLAEIAKLKARFKQVQNIMNTTEMIEEHIASKSNNAPTTALESSLGKLKITNAGSEVQSPSVTSTTNLSSAVEGNTTIETGGLPNLDSYAPPQTANEELLSAMMNMFSDFTADLRSQADDLRAERDRLRALKEDLLRRKRQS